MQSGLRGRASDQTIWIVSQTTYKLDLKGHLTLNKKQRSLSGPIKLASLAS